MGHARAFDGRIDLESPGKVGGRNGDYCHPPGCRNRDLPTRAARLVITCASRRECADGRQALVRQHVWRGLLFLPPAASGVATTGAACGTRFAIRWRVSRPSRTGHPRMSSQCVARHVVRDRSEGVRAQVADLREFSPIVVDTSGGAGIIKRRGLFLDSEGVPTAPDEGVGSRPAERKARRDSRWCFLSS